MQEFEVYVQGRFLFVGERMNRKVLVTGELTTE